MVPKSPPRTLKATLKRLTGTTDRSRPLNIVLCAVWIGGSIVLTVYLLASTGPYERGSALGKVVLTVILSWTVAIVSLALCGIGLLLSSLLAQQVTDARSVQRSPNLTPGVATAAALVIGAVFSMPYAYFTLLRWAASAWATYVVWIATVQRRPVWVLLFAAVLVLFNPIVPIDLTRQWWQPLDILTACIIALATHFLRLRSATADPSRRSSSTPDGTH